MPKSYKVTFTERFQEESFQLKPYVLNRQANLDGIPPQPQTVVYKSREVLSFEDFCPYVVEHEMEENAIGRTNGYSFQKYIRKEIIKAYYSKSHQLFLLSGKKKHVLDFCKKTKDIPEITFQTFVIDMGALLAKLPHVKGVWFHFSNGLIRASALMGANVEATTDFQKFKEEGDISTLSFLYEFNGKKHPIMVTSDGAVVLYDNFKEISEEISIVIDLFRNLLNDIYSTESV